MFLGAWGLCRGHGVYSFMNSRSLMLKFVFSIILASAMVPVLRASVQLLSFLDFPSDDISITFRPVSFAGEYEIVLEKPVEIDFSEDSIFIEISSDAYYKEFMASEYADADDNWAGIVERHLTDYIIPGEDEIFVVLYGDDIELWLNMSSVHYSRMDRKAFLKFSVLDDSVAELKYDRIKIINDAEMELRNVGVILSDRFSRAN